MTAQATHALPIDCVRDSIANAIAALQDLDAMVSQDLHSLLRLACSEAERLRKAVRAASAKKKTASAKAKPAAKKAMKAEAKPARAAKAKASKASPANGTAH